MPDLKHTLHRAGRSVRGWTCARVLRRSALAGIVVTAAVTLPLCVAHATFSSQTESPGNSWSSARPCSLSYPEGLPVTPSLYWSFSGGSGATVADDSGNGSVGDIQDTSSFTWKPGDCQTGNDSPHAEIGPYPYPLIVSRTWTAAPVDFTIQVWFKSDPTTTTGGLFGFSDDPSRWEQLKMDRAFYLDDAGHLMFRADVGLTLDSGVVVADRLWHQAVGVMRDGKQAELYLDGKLVTAGTIPSGAARTYTGRWSAGELNLGGLVSPNSNWAFVGSIDGIGVYPRAFSAEEINLLRWGGH